jgi:hypothetical protein
MPNKYDVKSMTSDIIEKFGLEHKMTIWFCELAETLTLTQLETAYIVLMAMPLEVIAELYEEEDEEPEYDDSADEVGFNPYMGSYDWDC